VANRLSGRPLYKWYLAGRAGEPIQASNGTVVVPETTIAEAPKADLILVCSSFEVAEYEDPEIHRFLRREARRGTRIGGIGSGAHVLALTRLLDGYRCTIHWELLPAFSENFPYLDVTANLYEIDRDRMTSGGGVAVMDMMLQLVAARHGSELAGQIASQLLHVGLRPATSHPRAAVKLQLEQRSQKLGDAVQLMESHIETPLKIPEIAHRLGLTQRQLERVFRRHCLVTPQQFYVDIRLDHARQLLSETSLPVVAVAVATGFAATSHFSVRYRRRFGRGPTEDRRIWSTGTYRDGVPESLLNEQAAAPPCRLPREKQPCRR
jgi:transcriptional regulator GlxA family with amidase domain